MSSPAIIAEIDAAEDRDTLRFVFDRYVRACGFTAFVVGRFAAKAGSSSPTDDPFLLINWPRAWLELYAREGFARDDAVVSRASQDPAPFTWSELRAADPHASARIFKAAATFGWHDGFVVPIHIGGEPAGAVSLASPGLGRLESPLRGTLVKVSVTTFHRARLLKDSVLDGVRLSRRERAALAIVADGGDDANIAAVLGVTRATAHFHVENAKRRLGASTRAQAVAVALRRGILDE